MLDYVLDTDLAEIQSVLSAMENKIKYYKANYPYATYEISHMETCVEELNVLIMDLIESRFGYRINKEGCVIE